MKIAIFLLFLVCVFSIEETNETITQNVEQTTNEIKQRTKEEILNERDSLQTLLKTLNYSCIVLARMQLSRYRSELMKVIESHQTKQEQHIIWKKIYTSYVNQCQQTITYDDSVKIFSEIQTKDFKFSDYNYIYENMTLEEYTHDKIDLHITQAEERIWTYIQEFEKAMNQKEDDDENVQSLKKNYDLEPKIFGFSLKQVKWLQYIAFSLFIALIVFLVYMAITKLPKQYGDKKKKN